MKSRPEPILILHHAIPAAGSCHNAESDAGVMDEVRAVANSLQKLNIPFRIAPVEALSALPALLQGAPERIVFNLVENFPGRPADAMQVPIICEAFGKECTGNESACQVLALDKWRTKAVLQAAGLPVPEGMIIQAGCGPASPALEKTQQVHSRGGHSELSRGSKTASKSPLPPPPPWIVKPLYADASEGIHASSVIDGDTKALAKAVARIHSEFNHPALVEQFFGTREINIALFQKGRELKVMPVAEIEFRGYGNDRPRIIDYAAKWHTDSFEYKNTVRVVPARIAKPLATRLQDAARGAWETLGCRDYARVDFRVDDKGNFVILEVNPNPDISPDSGFEAALKAARIPYQDFVLAMVQNAHRRLGQRQPSRKASPKSQGKARKGPEFAIRPTAASDREGILGFMRGTGFFHEGEIEVAREVLDEAIAKGPKGHYQSFTLLEAGRPAGWICYGPTPCTDGTFDIYWIGVSADCQGRGYGRALLVEAEKRIRRKKGRVIIIETSGRPLYDSTRGFYLKTGYHEAARVADFYAPDDARVIYAKALLK